MGDEAAGEVRALPLNVCNWSDAVVTLGCQGRPHIAPATRKHTVDPRLKADAGAGVSAMRHKRSSSGSRSSPNRSLIG